MTNLAIISALFCAAAACGGSSQNAAEPAPTQPVVEPQPGPAPMDPTPAPAPNPNDELATQGESLYGMHCAKCHGDAGQGSAKGPPVVGKGALPKTPPPGAKKRKVTFSTAHDIGAWVMKNMPGDKPGSLKPDEYLAILAFDLKANGVALPAEQLTVEGLKAIVINP